ncbi:hypothetical protein FOMPIDRAFT_1052836 [Fomitopsis schrenkii]|uniref:Uncharacterized protein n=1 Tax=Fomitopsis schrenkii TaxID=2126942 RepID=S8FEZ9_FOMSC|nr:hypothetical protein FOMPIDRAFT_1052836 [Fomitopsis schrenkii]
MLSSTPHCAWDNTLTALGTPAGLAIPSRFVHRIIFDYLDTSNGEIAPASIPATLHTLDFTRLCLGLSKRGALPTRRSARDALPQRHPCLSDGMHLTCTYSLKRAMLPNATDTSATPPLLTNTARTALVRSSHLFALCAPLAAEEDDFTTGVGLDIREPARTVARVTILAFVVADWVIRTTEAYMLCSVSSDLCVHEVVRLSACHTTALPDLQTDILDYMVRRLPISPSF